MSFFTRLSIQSHAPHALIAPHPRLRDVRLMRMMILIFSVMTLILTVSMIVIARVTLGDTLIPWPLLFTILMWLCIFGFSFLIEQWWKPLAAFRVAAVEGDHRLLADEQPQPNAEALDVPVKIVMRRSRKGLLIFGPSLSLLLVSLVGAVFLLVEQIQHRLDAFAWLSLLAMTVFAGTIIACMFAVFWRQRWGVEVRQQGMRSMENGASLMFWHEARLFACYREPRPWNRDSALIYELSSASQVILWIWVQKKETRTIRIVPTIPFEEHQTQMRALRDLIAARTGLPLYEMRK